MKDNWKSIVIALVIFCAGLATGIIIHHPYALFGKKHGPPPQHPFPAMREFGRGEGPGPFRGGEPPAEIKEYEAKIDAIVTPYRKKIRDVLNPTQQTAFDKLIDVPMPPPPHAQGDRPPMPPPEFQGDRPPMPPPQDRDARDERRDRNNDVQRPPQARAEGQQPDRNNGGRPAHMMGGGLRFVGLIVYKPVLEYLTEELKLDEKQKAAIATIMDQRRAELLKFVDNTPPPTIRMRLRHDQPPTR